GDPCCARAPRHGARRSPRAAPFPAQVHDVPAAPIAAMRRHHPPHQFLASQAHPRRRRGEVGRAQDQTSRQPGVVVVFLRWPSFLGQQQEDRDIDLFGEQQEQQPRRFRGEVGRAQEAGEPGVVVLLLLGKQQQQQDEACHVSRRPAKKGGRAAASSSAERWDAQKKPRALAAGDELDDGV
ncbi:unnamed protein product, partial [Urochloa humidicola]